MYIYINIVIYIYNIYEYIHIPIDLSPHRWHGDLRSPRLAAPAAHAALRPAPAAAPAAGPRPGPQSQRPRPREKGGALMWNFVDGT